MVSFNEDGSIFEQTLPGKGIGGLGTISPEHACDGKGIDYLEACGG